MDSPIQQRVLDRVQHLPEPPPHLSCGHVGTVSETLRYYFGSVRAVIRGEKMKEKKVLYFRRCSMPPYEQIALCDVFARGHRE